MRFLTITAMKDVAAIAPKSPMRQMLKATIDWIDKEKKAGRVIEAHAIPGGKGVILFELPSADAAAQAIASIPIGPFMSYDVYTLADMTSTMKAYIQNIVEPNQ